MTEVSLLTSNAQTVELILPDGFVRGAYQAGVLKVLVPYLLEQGLKIKYISARSIGSANAVLVAGALNTGQPEKVSEVLNDFWRDVGKLGDKFLFPARMVHKVTDIAAHFKINAGAAWRFPNLAPPLQLYFSQASRISNLICGKTPLEKFGEIIEKHMTPEMWEAVGKGYTETSIRASKPVPGLKTLRAIDISGPSIDSDSVLSSCAAKILGPHQGLLDGTYVRKSLYPAKPRTDIILSIPCVPGNAVPTKREQQSAKDRARLFYDHGCSLQRIAARTSSEKTSGYNFASKHIEILYQLGQQTGHEFIAEDGPTLLSRQTDIPNSKYTRKSLTCNNGQVSQPVNLPSVFSPAVM